jgi:hypothetical protein
MNNKLLGALGAIAILAGAGLAFQVAGAPTQKDNLVASRLGGMWTLERSITARLDQQGMQPPYTLEFVKGDTALLKAILDVTPRLPEESIYMWGKAYIAGDENWFVLTNFYGDATLLFFTPTRSGPVMDPIPVNINIAYSWNPAKDILFFGGDIPGKSAAAYVRSFQ